MKIKFLFGFLILLLVGGCSVPRNITYFDDSDYFLNKQLSDSSLNYNPRFKCGDKLVIVVSGIDPVSVAPFNLPITTVTDIYQTQTNSVVDRKALTATQSYLPYTVDTDGYINFPVLGKILVKDKTMQELTAYLEKRISESVDNPIVNIKIDNFKVSVIGEVTRPGSFTVYSDRISLLDALGMAGDLTIYGDRQDLRLVRDVNGKKEVIKIDLTKTNLIDSPYFYLQQNDVVYVSPNDKKKKSSRYSQTEQYNLSFVSTIVSSVSVLTSLVISIIALKK
jgi:polysaccharide biosynthesis/export protein